MRRTLTPLSLVVSLLLLIAACGDDGGGDVGVDEGDPTADSIDAELPDETSATDDVPATTVAADEDRSDTLCGDLAAVAEIDPSVQPTQGDVDLVRGLADDTSGDVADSFATIADVGQFIADLGPDDLDDPEAFAGLDDIATEDEQAAAGQTLVDFADEACGLSVPLFENFVP
ncbi:MAG: hypothetical protein KDB10_02815 [Acidimicrobiales bacterium]|nr:hypothetical protein [Acidimicrobiales bacterium]MCB9371466.1 hypothetical protein [Microthrixaceae bacterium]